MTTHKLEFFTDLTSDSDLLESIDISDVELQEEILNTFRVAGEFSKDQAKRIKSIEDYGMRKVALVGGR